MQYLPSTDALHYLTITPAVTNTTIGSASATFSGVSDQTVNLSAQVGSTAGTINEGSITFTIRSGGNPVGASVVASVTANAASASYNLLKGTPGGTYQIQAVYSDPVNFKTSTGTNALSVTAAATTASASGATATFSEISGEGTSLSATVSSGAGTINQGSVTFTILNGATPIAGPFVMSVTNGAAGGNVFIPAGTSAGSYIIQAVYNGTASFAASLPATSNLTISAAATTTAAAAASTAFSTAPQNVALSATVTSTVGSVGEGTVTFTILNGSTPVGSPVPATVSGGVANASYALPAAASTGSYTIKAVYTDTGSFLGSSDFGHSLTVTAPPPTKLVIFTPPGSAATAGKAFSAAARSLRRRSVQRRRHRR